jgi:hypothetical protein
VHPLEIVQLLKPPTNGGKPHIGYAVHALRKPFQRLEVNLIVICGFIRGVGCGRDSESG